MSIFSDFKDFLTAADRSQHTVIGYLSDLQIFARWFEKHTGEPLSPDKITASDLRAYRDSLVAKGRNASTTNRRLTSITAYLNWAVEAQLRPDNPALHIHRIKTSQTLQIRWLTRKEQSALRRAIEYDLQISRWRYKSRKITRQRDASIVIFMLHTGLRVQELSNLRLDDITLNDRSGNILVRYGKGGKQRRIPLNTKARKALQDWLAVRPETTNPYLFIPLEQKSPHKNLISRGLQRIVKYYGKAANLPNLTPHMLRHTFAKNLVNSGVSLEKVAALLGHSSLNTTRIYITPSQQDLAKAVENLS